MGNFIFTYLKISSALGGEGGGREIATDVSKVTRKSRPGPLKKLKTLSQSNTPRSNQAQTVLRGAI